MTWTHSPEGEPGIHVEFDLALGRVAAVDLVTRDPADAVSSVQEPGQFQFGREDGVLAEPRCPAAVRIAGPGARDVQFAVHRRVPALAGVDEVDSDLGVLDPPGSAGVGAGPRQCGCPSSRRRSRRRPAQRPRRGGARRTRARRHGRPRHPRRPCTAGAACRAGWPPRPTLRSSSSSYAADPTADPSTKRLARRRVRSARTGQRSGSMAASNASRQRAGLCCGLAATPWSFVFTHR